tara:strand:+ start:1427 stop:1606 length:180 start_codon:yes stop_codon:yes gene_type:complete
MKPKKIAIPPDVGISFVCRPLDDGEDSAIGYFVKRKVIINVIINGIKRLYPVIISFETR